MGSPRYILIELAWEDVTPKGTLKPKDKYQTKIELASEIITELVEFGFNIELVLADSLYGEASLFIANLDKYKI